MLIETGDDPDTFQSEPRSNGQQAPAETQPAAQATKKLTRDEYLNVVITNLGYDNIPHVLATMKLLGFERVVPNDSDERKRIYEALKEYRAYRDAGMSQDEALQAMADREVQDVG